MGRFITLEGGEGAGKSTQSCLLADWLRGQGFEVVATREPGGTPGGEEIRRLLLNPPRGGEGSGSGESSGGLLAFTQALLHYAARFEHLERVIRPALARGAWVICDRFADSTLIYQGVGQGVAWESIRRLHRLVVGELKPDLTLIFDLPVEVGLARAAAARAADAYESRDREFHERLRDGFLRLAKEEAERCRIIQANRPLEDVHLGVVAALAERFGLSAPPLTREAAPKGV